MRFKKLKDKIMLALAVATITGTIGGNTALAAENYNLPDDVPEVKELTLEDFKAIDTFDFRGAFQGSPSAGVFTTRSVSVLNTGDSHEPNDTIATATTGVQGDVVTGTIHSSTDVDYYRFEVTANVPLSIILYNMPSGCDYDLYLFNEDQSGWYTDFKDGSLEETFYISLEDSGTYYVAVASNSGSSTNNTYSLYFGNSYVYGSTDWRDPDLSFAFGSVPRGGSKTSLTSNINLANDISIPNGATVTQFLLSDEGTGGDYAGFYKYIKPSSGSTISQLGGLQAMVVPEDTPVKQNWQIWGSVQYSNYFTWEPRYFIQYTYFVTPLTAAYLL